MPYFDIDGEFIQDLATFPATGLPCVGGRVCACDLHCALQDFVWEAQDLGLRSLAHDIDDLMQVVKGQA